jgi:hypothetical protein
MALRLTATPRGYLRPGVVGARDSPASSLEENTKDSAGINSLPFRRRLTDQKRTRVIEEEAGSS